MRHSHGRIKPTLTANDVAILLNVHLNTVRRWSNQGLLNDYRIGPRGDRRFTQEDIGRFLVEQAEKGEKSTSHGRLYSAGVSNQIKVVK